MRTKDITKGTKVTTPSGTTAKVTAIRVEKTGRKGRPTTLFSVNGVEYRAKDLKAGE